MISDLVGKRVLVKLPMMPVMRGLVIRLVEDDPMFPLIVKVDGRESSELPAKLAEVLLDE